MGFKIKEYLELVTFQHTIFALPFAYIGMILGARGIPAWPVWLWITVVMIGARTFGMTMNRLVDHQIDARNPRTQNRPLPAGKVSRRQAWGLAIVSVLLVIVGCLNLNWTALVLSPVILGVMWLYAYLKRFTWMSHFVLGGILGSAPVLGWLAAAGTIGWQPVMLAFAVLFWVAGFDILYATQDVEFDRKEGLWSMPSLVGIPTALVISRVCHMATFFILIFLGWILHLGIWYWGALLVVGPILYWQHRIVSPDDLSRVNRAFFVMNGWVSVILFAAVLLDVQR
ncbi:MAG: UbiA family prenyltransferase [Candidatus Omnitrophica bacterium]|nr:UbiA family prenyltransferase [Candidatus Omnitrophota bacterium]